MFNQMALVSAPTVDTNLHYTKKLSTLKLESVKISNIWFAVVKSHYHALLESGRLR